VSTGLGPPRWRRRTSSPLSDHRCLRAFPGPPTLTRHDLPSTTQQSITPGKGRPPTGESHPRLRLACTAPGHPHDNPPKRIWAASEELRGHTAVKLPRGRLPGRSIPSFRPRLTRRDAGYRRALDRPWLPTG